MDISNGSLDSDITTLVARIGESNEYEWMTMKCDIGIDSDIASNDDDTTLGREYSISDSLISCIDHIVCRCKISPIPSEESNLLSEIIDDIHTILRSYIHPVSCLTEYSESLSGSAWWYYR